MTAEQMMENLKEEIRTLEEEVDMILFNAEEADRELTEEEVAEIQRLERVCEGLVDEWRSMRG